MIKKKYFVLFLISLTLFETFNVGLAQIPGDDSIQSDDLSTDGDIFSDFNSEDFTSTQMAEDERFYRYGRFFSFGMGIGLTSYDGNRGAAYNNEPPSYALHLNYFMNFRVSFGLGFEFSKHHFFIDEPVLGFASSAPGLISVGTFRVFFGYRYYIDTSDLNTAITYANPYFTGRLEYWYLSNKFEDQSALPDDSGGGLGFGMGLGLEFPIKIKVSYIGLEFLFHAVNFHDKYTQKYRPLEGSSFGYDDLTGSAYSTMLIYVLNW